MKKYIIDDHKGVYNELKDILSWNYIDTMNLTTAEIEDFYQSFPLDVVGKEKDDYIEKKLHIEPSMVGFFYYFLKLFNRIPTQNEFIKFYYLTNKKWVKEKVYDVGYHQAFVGRLSRFYPSMLRDFHFYHLLKESNEFTRVLFCLKYDLEAKVDIFVEKNKKWYGIQLRTKTFRSKQFYQDKWKRKPIPVKATLIDLPIDLDKAYSLSTKKNSIKLYSTYHINEILHKISEIENLPTDFAG